MIDKEKMKKICEEHTIQTWVIRYWDTAERSEETVLEQLIMQADQAGISFTSGIEFFIWVTKLPHFKKWAKTKEDLSDEEREILDIDDYF